MFNLELFVNDKCDIILEHGGQCGANARLSGFKSLYAVAVMWSAITRGAVSEIEFGDHITIKFDFVRLYI